jgi:hypothetical protein
MSTTTPNPSSSRHAAPIGAITSRLVGRSTLELPPSDQSYEPLVKSLFRNRLRYMLLLSASSTWCVISCWTWWQSGGVLKAPWTAIVLLFGPLTLFNTALNWAMVALPVIVLHKVFLTGKWLNHHSAYFCDLLCCRTSVLRILSDYHRQKFFVTIQHQNCIRNASSVRNLCFTNSRLYGLHV